MAVVMALSGFGLNIAATQVNNQDYDVNLSSSDPQAYFNAVSIYPERVDAYNALIEYCKNHDSSNEEITKVGNAIEANAESLDANSSDIADMYYDMGKLYFSDYDDSFKSRAVNAQSFFKVASESQAEFDKKAIANCYYAICRFMTNQSTTSEHSLDDFTTLITEIEDALNVVEQATDSEANYDKISLYYVTMLLINDQAEYMAGVGVDQETVNQLMEELYDKANGITSTLTYVNGLRDDIMSNYDLFMSNIRSKYQEVEKRRQGGNA